MQSLEPHTTLVASDCAMAESEARSRADWALLHSPKARFHDRSEDVFDRHLLGVSGEIAACKIFRAPFDQLVTRKPRPDCDLVFSNGTTLEIKTTTSDFVSDFPDIVLPLQETADIVVIMSVSRNWKSDKRFRIHSWAWSRDIKLPEYYYEDESVGHYGGHVYPLLEALLDKTAHATDWDPNAFPRLVEILNHPRPVMLSNCWREMHRE